MTICISNSSNPSIVHQAYYEMTVMISYHS
jgi:hypothetical protein